jgi:hypothetical protein
MKRGSNLIPEAHLILSVGFPVQAKPAGELTTLQPMLIITVCCFLKRASVPLFLGPHAINSPTTHPNAYALSEFRPRGFMSHPRLTFHYLNRGRFSGQQVTTSRIADPKAAASQDYRYSRPCRLPRLFRCSAGTAAIQQAEGRAMRSGERNSAAKSKCAYCCNRRHPL